MTEADRIPTEIIQRLTPVQAWEYMLVPEKANGDYLECLGDGSKDYADYILELEVLYDLKIKVKPVKSDLLQKLLHQYYRNDERGHKKKSNSISEIGNGQVFLKGLIEEAFECYASDIHIEIYEEKCRIRFRIDGKLIERYVIQKVNYASLINQVKILSNLDISEKRLPQDGRILFKQGDNKFDVRVSSLPTIYGEKIVFRLLTRHAELLELKNLGFDDKQLTDYYKAIEKPHGLVLICGPTGSGKSTTLYATLRHLNNEKGNILTIEDPVEYTLTGVNQVQLKEDIGLTFTSALRSFLRQDPDIIMLGEIRDPDTAQMAMRSALTGHMIFSTIHTNSAWGSIDRLMDMDIYPYMIANTLVLTVAQRLVRRLCPFCKKKENVTPDMQDIFKKYSKVSTHYVAGGCEKCFYTGFSGRKAIYEVIPVDNELAMAIKNKETNIDQLLKARKIIPLRDAAMNMLIEGETSYSEILSIVRT